MRIELSLKGKDLKLTESFRQQVAGKVRSLGKYFNRPADMKVVVHCERRSARAEVHVRCGRLALWARAEAEQPGRAVDEAIARVDEQLRRRKDRLKTRKGREASSRLQAL